MTEDALYKKLGVCEHPSEFYVIASMGHITEHCYHKCGKTLKRIIHER